MTTKPVHPAKFNKNWTRDDKRQYDKEYKKWKKMERISQSFISTMRDYVAGEECGNIVKHQYVDGKLIDWESDSMDEGMYFEYLLTKAIPKNGNVPQPVYMATPLKSKKKEDLTVADMTAPYRCLHGYAAQVTALFAEWGWEVVDVGKRFVLGRFEGTIDITVKCTKHYVFQGVTWNIGDKLCVDVKLTGLLNNRWEKFGWMWEPIQKAYRKTQAIQYHHITKLPFYYLVVSSTTKEEDGPDGKKIVPPTDVRLFHIPVSAEMIEAHVIEANHLKEKFELEAAIGFTPRPEYFKCSKCPIRDVCGDKYTFPRPEVIDLA